MKGIKIVYSGEDPAGSNVASQLRKNHGFAEEKFLKKTIKNSGLGKTRKMELN